RSLAVGDRIAAPRRLPSSPPHASMPDHELVLLAALIADGSITQHTPVFCFGSDSPLVAEVEAAAAKIGVRLNIPRAGWGSASLSNRRGSGSNPVTELLKRHKLW